MNADTIAERLVALVDIAGVQFLKRSLRLANGGDEVWSCIGIVQRKDGQQTVTHELQNFAAVLLDRLRQRIEIAVQQFDDIVTRPKVGDARKVAQVADHDHRAHRIAATPSRRALQNFLAGMRADIGF